MKVVIDTNVLISSLVFPSEMTRAILRHIAEQGELLVPWYVASEARTVVARKWPWLVDDTEELLARLTVVPQSLRSRSSAPSIRDPKDAPILEAALDLNAYIILSGDKDFGALDMERPSVMTMRAFYDEFVSGQYED